MGKLFQLFGMVELREMSDEFATITPQQRQERIDKLASSSKLIGMYSPEEFPVMFRGEVVTIKKGWHEYSPQFAVWALQKYGKGSKYGKTYRTVNGKEVANPELLDEAPAGEKAEQKPEPKPEPKPEAKK
jgi:hypothetical protein